MKEFISKLTWVDYVALLAVLRGCYVGYKSGLFPELLRIAAYVVTVLVTFHFHDTVAQIVTLKTFLNETTASALSFLALAAGTFFLATFFTKILLKLLKVGEGGFIYRLIGLAVGACRWLLLLSLIFMLIDYSPLAPLKKDIHDRSLTGAKVASAAPLLFDFLSSLSPQLAVKKAP